ncbi:MAG: ribosome silencing factor, partial [Clostridia bacterium]|nr:ribosome silencing factor [Clostridia bacterium]
RLYMTRFARTMQMLLGTGVAMLEAMQISSRATANLVVEDIIMEAKELAEKICKVLSDKKALDVTCIFVAEKTIVADYYVIATAKSSPHVKALSEYVEEEIEKNEIVALRREGTREGRWAVIDYGDVIVHIFNDETRDFYNLEKLWADGGNVVKFGEDD